jgi:broad specificity phosphatase PhoE
MIYILRHFRVKDNTSGWLDAKAYNLWTESYDRMELEYLDIKLPKVDEVYCSPKARTIMTAQHLKLIFTLDERLIEVPTTTFSDKLRLPKGVWLIIDRLLWALNLSKAETKEQTKMRAKSFVDELDFKQDVLIVTHGFYMKTLIAELKNRGFKGEGTFDGDSYHNEIGWMEPFYKHFTPAIRLDQYKTDNSPYLSFTSSKSGFWNRKLDYIFTNHTLKDGKVLQGGTMALSDHAPVVATWREND